MSNIIPFPPARHDLHSEKIARIGEHEVILWSNGAVTLEHWQYQMNLNPMLDHAQITPGQARGLRKFLNTPAVKTLLGIPGAETRTTEQETQLTQLGAHAIEINAENGRIAIGDSHNAVELDAGETYRLFVVLREMFK